MKLPVLNLDEGDEQEQASRAWGMLRDESYFLLTGSPIDSLPTAGLLDVARKFFAQPLAEKLRTYIAKSGVHRGYLPTGEEGSEAEDEPDLKEGFDSGLENLGPSFRYQIPQQAESGWPEILGFRETVESYRAQMQVVATRTSRVMSLALGQSPEYLSQRAKSPPNQLRLLHYPATQRTRQGVGEHTDFECFTFLATTGPGLEVKRPNGRWVSVTPDADQLVVTIGDLFETLTNGALRATPHRVGWVKSDRYSFPYFWSFDSHEVVRPLSNFVHDGETHYADLDVGTHLWRRTAEVFKYLRDGALPEEAEE